MPHVPILRDNMPLRVDYGRLADIGRKIVEDEVGRSLTETLIRKALIFIIPIGRSLES